MPKFDRYFLSQLLVLFGFFALVLVSVYWLNQAVRLFDQLIGDGQSALVFLQFTALALPNVIRLVLPIAGFVATLYCVNRLLSESELVVVQAMGFSSLRLALPVAVFGLFVSVLVMILNSFLVPLSYTQLVEQKTQISRNVSSKLLTEGRFLQPSDGVTFFIRNITDQGEMRDVFLSDNRESGREVIYTAARALLVPDDDGPKLLMFDGMAQILETADNRLSVTHFSDSVFNIGDLYAPPSVRKQAVIELSTATLLAADPALVKELELTRAEFLQEGHSRIAQPLLALAGALLAFATLILGSFSRFGVWRQILIAVCLAIGLSTFYNLMSGLALDSAMNWPLLYLPGLGGSAVALALLWLNDHPGLWRRTSRTGGAHEA